MTVYLRPRTRRTASVLALILALALFVTPHAGFAAPGDVVMDGEFEDWNGRAYLPDPYDDTKHHWDDVRYWYWATNDNVSALFFMIERYEHSGHNQEQDDKIKDEDPAYAIPFQAGIQEGKDKDKKQVHYTIFVDLDNDGRFDEPTDATIFAAHYPKYEGLTLVNVFGPNQYQTYTGMWGDPDNEGGRRVEFPVPFSYLGIEAGQVIRMTLFATDKRKDWDDPDPISEYERLVDRREADRVPDDGDLQWSPVSTLGDFGWIALIGTGVAIPVLLKRRGRMPG